MKKTLHITMGLPGSGKTSWSRKFDKSNNDNVYNSSQCIEMDKLGATSSKTIRERVIEHILAYSRYEHVIVDSFMSSSEQLKGLLNDVIPKAPYTEVIVHYWEPNVEACLWNDRGRRDQSSSTSIKNATLEKVDPEEISAHIKTLSEREIKVKLETHITTMKPDWEVFYEEVCKEIAWKNDKGEICSSSWCLGGDWVDCWGSRGGVSAESTPATFREFDEIIEKVCPEISFMKYKKLWNSLVSTEEFGKSDFYGGHTNNAYFCFKVEKLYNALVEEGLYEIKR